MAEIVYHGTHHGSAGAGTFEVIEDGQVTGLLHHVVRHSPTGFSRGYAGSGPADLARSLLIAALGDDAKCPTCGGTSQIVFDSITDRSGRPYDPARDAEVPADPDDEDYEGPLRTRCHDCDSGYLRLPHQAFKFQRYAEAIERAGWRTEYDERKNLLLVTAGEDSR
jgi:hypothetical protein